MKESQSHKNSPKDPPLMRIPKQLKAIWQLTSAGGWLPKVTSYEWHFTAHSIACTNALNPMQ